MSAAPEAGLDAAVVASAPGKVLITGAYLILEQPNAGLVLSASARFYALVSPVRPAAPPDSWSWSWADVVVISPQLFLETPYKMSLRDFSLRKVNSSDKGSSFVEHSIISAASAARHVIGHDLLVQQLLRGLQITILGDNNFYSFRKQLEARGLPLLPSTLASLPPFSPITVNPASASKDELLLPEVAKTGLGSSAAMTTSIVSAVLQYLGVVSLPGRNSGVIQAVQVSHDLDLIHKVSQSAHCAAQGKIGSGFDVSAAVYGSQRYVRFSPSILSPAEGTTGTASLLNTMELVLSKQWDGEKVEYALPPWLSLVVGEPGFGGSHTPSMVGAVQKWRRNSPEDAQRVWEDLANANKAVEAGLFRISQIADKYEDAYAHVLKLIGTLPAQKWQQQFADNTPQSEVVTSLLETRQAFLQVRTLLQTMGESAGVPIEPPSQTALLDATMAIDGVLLAGVPGAGGYDAVFAITAGDHARALVEKEWSSRGVLSLSVCEDPNGVRLEPIDPRSTAVVDRMQTLRLKH